MTTRELPREEWPRLAGPERMAIRPATDADVPALVTMAARFFPAVGYDQHLHASVERMAALARFLLVAGCIFVAATAEGHLVGMLGLLLFDHPMADERCASELFWWVDPSRRGRVGLQLLRAGETWARAQGATALLMAAPNNGIGKLYQRLGFSPLEASYVRRL